MSTDVTPTTGTADASASPTAPDFSRFETMLSGLESEVKESKAESKASKEQLEAIRKVFSNETAPPPEEIELQEFMADFEAARKRGIEMPITEKLAKKLADNKKSQSSELAELKEKIKKLEAAAGAISDPGYQSETAALYKMSDILVDTLKGMYGAVDTHIENAVAQKIRNEIDRIKKEAPDNWNEIRKSERLQKAMVNHFVKQVIPVKARELMDKEVAENTPIDMNALGKAFKEAKEMKDPEQRSKAIRYVRQQYWAHKFSSPGKRA